MITKKKILIYDSSRGYSRFIKLNFKDFEVINFSEFNNYKDINTEDFDAVFFIVNYPIELVDLICLQQKTALIFVGTRLLEIADKVKDFDNTIFLDLQQIRSVLLDLIQFNFIILGILDDVDALS